MIISLAVSAIFLSSVSGQEGADYLMRARALRNSGKMDEALAGINRAVINVKDYRLLLERAEINMSKNDVSGAISDFNEADKLMPGSGEYGLARIYARKGDAQTSVYHLANSMNSAFKKSEKEILLEASFSRIESTPEWRQFWKKEWYTGLEKNMSELEYDVSGGKTTEANEILSEIKDNYPGSDEAVYCEALVCLASGKTIEAVKSISGITQQNPGNEKYLNLLAKAQLASSNPAGASETYTSLLNRGSEDAGLLLSRAECYRKTGESDKALADINKYLEYYPGDKNALSLAGKSAATAGDNLKALEYFSENLKQHPDDAGCYIDRGNSYLNARSWDWAIKDYSMSLDLKPGNPEAWLNMGVAQLNQGKADEACFDFRQAFNLGNRKAADLINRNCIK